MLQLRRLSLLRQLNPSILTAGLLTKVPPMGPTSLSYEDGNSDDVPDAGTGIIECSDTGETFSSPNLVSCINGLDTLRGGDPLKNGGDEAACVHVFSDAL